MLASGAAPVEREKVKATDKTVLPTLVPFRTGSVLVHFAHDGYASMGCVADYVFELDSGVMDFEFPAQTVVDRPQNRIALRGGDVGNFHMRGKRVVL